MALHSFLLVVMLEVPLEQYSLVKGPPELCNLVDVTVEEQDPLLQEYVLLLVGPSKVGRTHTGRILQQSSEGARWGNLGQSDNLLLEMVLEVQVLVQVHHLLLLVGPSRVGLRHTGRIPPQSSQGGRKGSLGWKYTSPSILARPRWRGRRRRGGRR